MNEVKYPNVKKINPNILDDSLKENLEECCVNLQQVVNFGAHLLKWHLEKVSGSDEKLAPSLFIRNIIELVDAIAILIQHSCIAPCKILFRTLIESYFACEYLMEGETDKRSMAFLVWRLNKNLEYYKIFIPDSNENVELKKIIKGEFWEKFIDIDNSEMSEIVGRIENTLFSAKYCEANNEFHKMKSKPKNWYSMFDGPKNLHGLSKYLNQSSMYKIFYTLFSDNAHGSDNLKGIIDSDKNGAVKINQIRIGKNYKEITYITVITTIFAYDSFIKSVLPEKEKLFREWIENEVNHFYVPL